MRKSAFTLIELIFVIVVMGILSKYGVELLSQAYKSFIFSSVNNALQANSAAAVESIASRLQYRIKDSVIARINNGNPNDFKALASSDYGDTATVLEWVSSDIDGFRGNSSTNPLWSGIIDLRNPSTDATTLFSPETNTTAINELIQVLSHNSGTTIANAAIYFVGSDSDINNYGWNGALTDHNTSVMHPIRSGGINQFVSGIGGGGVDDFSGVNVYEYYQLAWTAYAVVHNDADDTLWLHYDYQPWEGDKYSDVNTKKFKIMDDVDTFRFKAVGSIVKIQVCVKTDLMEEYSLCKEKTIF